MITIVNIFMLCFQQASMYAPLLLGAYISIGLLRIPDLSIESAFVCGALTAFKVLATFSDFSPTLALTLVLPASISAGISVGLLSSFIRLYGKVPPLLASIITLGIFYGINQALLGSSNSSLGTALTLFTHFMQLAPNPVYSELVIIFCVASMSALAIACITRSQLGYALYVCGVQPLFFKHYAQNAHAITMLGMLISNGLAGLSGALIAQSQGFVDISMGSHSALLCITALSLGRLFSRQLFSYTVPIVGIIAYFLLEQCIIQFGLNTQYFTTFQALLLLAITLVSQSFISNKSIYQDNNHEHIV